MWGWWGGDGWGYMRLSNCEEVLLLMSSTLRSSVVWRSVFVFFPERFVFDGGEKSFVPLVSRQFERQSDVRFAILLNIPPSQQLRRDREKDILHPLSFRI